MAGEIENFWDKKNSNGLAKNPQNINKKWQPRKGIALVNYQLAEEWILPATKQDIEANYMAMIQLWQEKLTEMANDKNQPMLIRIIAKNMLWGKGFDIVEKMLDRGIGKAKITEEVNHSWNITIWNILKKVQWLENNVV